jgi:hypothetical protein
MSMSPHARANRETTIVYLEREIQHCREAAQSLRERAESDMRHARSLEREANERAAQLARIKAEESA